MERNALQQLVDWDRDKKRKPLIVWGARQVGKTYLICELLLNSITRINTSISIVRSKMRYVLIANLQLMQERSLNIFRLEKVNK